MTMKGPRVAVETDSHQRSAFSTAHHRDDPRDLTRQAAQRSGTDLLDWSLCDDYARSRTVFFDREKTKLQTAR